LLQVTELNLSLQLSVDKRYQTDCWSLLRSYFSVSCTAFLGLLNSRFGMSSHVCTKHCLASSLSHK